MKKNQKTERGYPSLFNELDRLIKRARRTNLEALENYSHGAQLRQALNGLIGDWDRFVFTEGTRGNSIRVRVRRLDSEEGDDNGS